MFEDKGIFLIYTPHGLAYIVHALSSWRVWVGVHRFEILRLGDVGDQRC